MNILITSPRAPIVLEWIKIAKKGKHTVALCDSLHFPVARFNRLGASYHRTPAPRLDFQGYQQAMLKLIAWADLVIPTCEDIFYLTKLALSDSERQKCWMPDSQLLFNLHHKLTFFDYLPDTPHLKKPTTKLIGRHDDIDFDTPQKTLLKPVFSRFGRSVVRDVNRQTTQHLTISTDYPWVQQQFITGQGLCNYAICEHGEVIAHGIYRPHYLLNDAAATYFEPVDDERAETFIHEFAKKNAYHGQVAFDFMDDGQDLWVLECNPRATSGLHLLGDSLILDSDGKLYQVKSHEPKPPLKVGFSLPLLFGVSAIKSGTFGTLWQDYKKGVDVIADIATHAHLLALGEMIWRKWRYDKPLTNASTFDIEYDGTLDDGGIDNGGLNG